jgi:hypothetical protein
MSNTSLVVVDQHLADHASKIRDLMTDVSKNSLALGAELDKARRYFKALAKKARPAPTWAAWLYEQFGISSGWANTLAGAAVRGKGSNIRKLAPAVIYLITSKSAKAAPPAAIKEIKRRVMKGEKVSKRKAGAIVRKHKTGTESGAKMPSPSEAKEIAAKTGAIIAASDGRLYTGASDEAVKAAEDRRTIVFGVREAVETLAAVAAKATPQQFLQLAMPHQLWTPDEETALGIAAGWLNQLVELWERKAA